MITQNREKENTQKQIRTAMKELKISKHLRSSNIRKSCGISASQVFQFLLLLVFQGKNLFRFLNSKYKEQAVSKNTYYRFLAEPTYNWKQFLLLLAVRVISAFDALTRPERAKVLILDDTIVSRNRSSKVELLAKVYNHVIHKYQKGFTLLTLGWSDGYSFIPVCFNMLSSAKESNRYQNESVGIDHRTSGYKSRMESIMKKTDAAVLLIQRALNAGILADYVLMDTWFTTEPMVKAILSEGLDVIGMVKQLKQQYIYKGREYTLPKLRRFMQHENGDNIMGSIIVMTKKEHIPVKIVFVRNRNRKSQCLYLLSTDCSLCESEVVRLYGNRWSIEVFFKASKSLFKLGTEFQSRSYDAIVGHTAIVFTRYILIEWIRRNKNDWKSCGELFYMFCDDIQDITLSNALQSLMALLVENLELSTSDIISVIKCKLLLWISSQPAFVQGLFPVLLWES